MIPKRTGPNDAVGFAHSTLFGRTVRMTEPNTGNIGDSEEEYINAKKMMVIIVKRISASKVPIVR